MLEPRFLDYKTDGSSLSLSHAGLDVSRAREEERKGQWKRLRDGWILGPSLSSTPFLARGKEIW